jgi:hypothetical protein
MSEPVSPSVRVSPAVRAATELVSAFTLSKAALQASDAAGTPPSAGDAVSRQGRGRGR